MKVAIAGGGLVGALCANVLGQKGHQVEVFEYRQDPRKLDARLSRGKSINLLVLSFSSRQKIKSQCRTTLARAGLEDLIISHGIPMKGRMLHSPTGATKPVLYDPNGNQCIYSVSRRYLNDALLTEAEKMSNVKLTFDHKLLSVDSAPGILHLRKKDGKQEIGVDMEADLVIGADGAHSAMRQSILKQSRTNFSQTYIEHGYMELSIPPNPNGEHAMEKNYLHIWPRNRFMLIALPNQDGSFTVTLFMPFEIFAQLSTAESVASFFRLEFPDALDLIGEELLISDFLTSTPSSLISITCSPLHDGKVVLIGDAAHAMVPFYGQGMNAGFEDVLILDDLLSNCSGEGVEKCLATFTEKRKEDAQAICELAMYNYLEMRHLVNQKGFYLRRNVDLLLNRIFGSSWMPLYNAVTFSRTPYAECIGNRKWQDETLDKASNYFFLGLAGCVVGSLVYWKDLMPIRLDINKHFLSFLSKS